MIYYFYRLNVLCCILSNSSQVHQYLYIVVNTFLKNVHYTIFIKYKCELYVYNDNMIYIDRNVAVGYNCNITIFLSKIIFQLH